MPTIARPAPSSPPTSHQPSKQRAHAPCQRGVDEIAVIGGTRVFEAALPLAHRIYKTEVHASPTGDAFFPAVDWREWREVSREALPRGPHDDSTSTLVVLERRQG